MAKCRTFQPDVIVLDIMLPDMDGIEVCKQIRTFSHCSILFLSSKSDDMDKILGLAAGGDDYVAKPFSYGHHHTDTSIIESGPVAFVRCLERRCQRLYRTEVQLYKSLLALKRGIDRDCIASSQREALNALRCVIGNIEYRFYKAYGMEIEDKRTVYTECAYHLVPKEDEPSVCLMHDWIYLPSA